MAAISTLHSTTRARNPFRWNTSRTQCTIRSNDIISDSPGFVVVARDGGSYNGALSGGDDDGGFEFTSAMAVLVTLVCMFVVLAALFVRTSSKRQQQPSSMGLRRRRRRGRSYDDDDDDDDELASVGKGSSISIGNVMCRDDDVEMDVACVERDLRVMKSRNDDDGDETDYSVGGFSVSIAVTGGGGEGGAQQHKWSRFITGSKSFGSGVGRSFGRKQGTGGRANPNNNGASNETILPIEDKATAEDTTMARAITPPTTQWANDDDDEDNANETAGPAPIESSFFGGLFTAVRPRAVSPDSEEVEVDVTSVYDCDAATSSYGVVGLTRTFSSAYDALTGGGGSMIFSSVYDCDATSVAVVSASGRSEPKLGAAQSSVYDCDATSIDGATAASAKTGPAYNAAPATGDDRAAVTPSPKKSILRFFSAREQQEQAGGRCISPHSEVEASLAPFDDVSEYSELRKKKKRRKGHGGRRGELDEVESRYLVPVTTNEDRIILTIGDDDDDTEGGRPDDGKSLSRKFGRLFKRGAGKSSNNGGHDELYVQEIHEIYSNDDDNDDNNVSRKPSPPATSVYTMQRKPSLLPRPMGILKSPSTLSNARSYRRQINEDAAAQEDNHHLLDEEETTLANADNDNTRCMIEIGADDGSVAYDCSGPMCSDVRELWRPNGWC
mmetsp:Transcript_9410/g.22962  ORF Transcript_9410/g.22962 Transcript_9410/m.22962 type:complete len:669 (-) Transcript_9410:143-2149(-)